VTARKGVQGMEVHLIRTEQEVDDLLLGLSIRSTGGGGMIEEGRYCLRTLLRDMGEIRFFHPSMLSDDDWVMTTTGIGGAPPQQPPSEDEQRAIMGEVRLSYEERTLRATKALLDYLPCTVRALVPFETGSYAVALTINSAARSSLDVVDADYAGRAVPEISQATLALGGCTGTPAALVDQWGNSVLIERATKASALEQIARAQCAASFGSIGAAFFPVSAQEAKRQMIPGALSSCQKLGEAVRAALSSGEDVVQKICNTARGHELFRGTVLSNKMEETAGYQFGYGTITIEGATDYLGHQFRIWYKNEYHLGWYDEKVVVSSPDLILLLDVTTSLPLPSSKVTRGQEIAVVGFATLAPDKYRSEQGLTVMGPRHFGFDIEYKPIEERMRPKR
jgi:hypothetical protein